MRRRGQAGWKKTSFLFSSLRTRANCASSMDSPQYPQGNASSVSCTSLRLGETDGLAVGFEECVGFLSGMSFHSAKCDDLADRLGVVAVGLHLRVDILDVVGDALLLLFEALNALDEKTQLVGCYGSISHYRAPTRVVPLPTMNVQPWPFVQTSCIMLMRWRSTNCSGDRDICER